MSILDSRLSQSQFFLMGEVIFMDNGNSTVGRGLELRCKNQRAALCWKRHRHAIEIQSPQVVCGRNSWDYLSRGHIPQSGDKGLVG